MRYGWTVALIVAGMGQLASAQRIIPAVEFTQREYGVSGSYMKHKDAADKNVSDMDVVGRWGVRFELFDLQVEGESGYWRHKVDAIDSTAQQFRIAGNVLMNFDVSGRLSLFGLAGYGYSRAWTDRVFDLGGETTTVETKNSFRFVQYGGGLKYLLVPNVGLRIDYRWEKGVGLADDEPNRDRQVLMLGLMVVQ